MPKRSARIYTVDEYVNAYKQGYRDGFDSVTDIYAKKPFKREPQIDILADRASLMGKPRTRKKLSAWNKFVKANSKKPRFIMRSGKLNLKKMGVAFRKTKR